MSGTKPSKKWVKMISGHFVPFVCLSTLLRSYHILDCKWKINTLWPSSKRMLIKKEEGSVFMTLVELIQSGGVKLEGVLALLGKSICWEKPRRGRDVIRFMLHCINKEVKNRNERAYGQSYELLTSAGKKLAVLTQYVLVCYQPFCQLCCCASWALLPSVFTTVWRAL